MQSEWADLPEPARGIAAASTDAVAAVRAADLDAYREASARLAGHHPEQVGIVTGETVRLLLEDRYADGLTGDDLRAVLSGCAATAGWYPDFDADVLVTLIAGALGVHEAEGERLPLAGPDMAAHAPLLIAELAGTAEHPLPVYLRAALAEIARTETMD